MGFAKNLGKDQNPTAAPRGGSSSSAFNGSSRLFKSRFTISCLLQIPGQVKFILADHPKNAACTAFMAFSPFASSTTTEILISLVEIMSMLIPSPARVSNIFAATPE